MDRTWRVVVRGPVSDEELAALPSDRMLWVSGHGTRGHSSTIWVRAPDAATAEEDVRIALSVPPVVESATPPSYVVLPPTRLPYLVSIGVPEEDQTALDRMLRERRRETGSMAPLISTEPSDGFAELMLDVDAATAQEAIDQAREDYRALRRAAGLSPVGAAYVNLHPPWQPDQQQHRMLLERAQRLLNQGALDLAVVTAQSSVEVLVAQVIEERLQARQLGGLRAHISRFRASRRDVQTRRLWMELTNDEIGRDATWEAYAAHVERRNELVHQGIQVDQAGASTSLAAAQAMVEHIESLPPFRGAATRT